MTIDIDKDAFQSIGNITDKIIGGLDRELMIELRQQFLALTKGEEHERRN